MTHSKYLREGLRPHCARRMGISPLLKEICTLRQLSYGLPTHLADNIFHISEATAALRLHHFCVALIISLGVFYLRNPTLAHITKIEMSSRKAGFPWCIGRLDFSGWACNNLPKDPQGIMVGKDEHPDVRMEVNVIWTFVYGRFSSA